MYHGKWLEWIKILNLEYKKERDTGMQLDSRGIQGGKNGE